MVCTCKISDQCVWLNNGSYTVHHLLTYPYTWEPEINSDQLESHDDHVLNDLVPVGKRRDHLIP